MGGVDHGASTNAVVEHGRDVRIAVLDWVIGGGLAAVGIARPVMAGGQFKVGMFGPGLGIIGPAALFEHHDPHPGFDEPFGGHRPGRTGAKNQNVRLGCW